MGKGNRTSRYEMRGCEYAEAIMRFVDDHAAWRSRQKKRALRLPWQGKYPSSVEFTTETIRLGFVNALTIIYGVTADVAASDLRKAAKGRW